MPPRPRIGSTTSSHSRAASKNLPTEVVKHSFPGQNSLCTVSSVKGEENVRDSEKRRKAAPNTHY
jgi:hypothetical protein